MFRSKKNMLILALIVMGIAVTLWLRILSVQIHRDSITRITQIEQLNRLGFAMNIFQEENNFYVPAVIVNDEKKPLYSWRVPLLPYLEYGAIYNNWKLSEPWDSPQNHSNSNFHVKEFGTSELGWDLGHNQTHYRVFYGNGAIFETSEVGLQKGPRTSIVSDGTSNTIMIAQTLDSIPWASPNDIAYVPSGPLPELGKKGSGFFLATFADGSVKSLKKTINPQILHQLIQRADGNPLPRGFDE